MAKPYYPVIDMVLIPQKLNLNGTSKDTLLTDYMAVLEALRNADKALARATPHGRDYQTHSSGDAAIEARRAWSQRRLVIDEMLKDFEHCAEMIAAQ